MEDKLDISSLKKAADRFYDALACANAVEAKLPADRGYYEFETASTSLIKHFEFCYELCWKTMQRFIQMDDVGSETIISSRKDLFRAAAEKRLIAEFDHWLTFHNKRNMSAHVYDLKISDDVYTIAKMFVGDLREFVETMEAVVKRM